MNAPTIAHNCPNGGDPGTSVCAACWFGLTENDLRVSLNNADGTRRTNDEVRAAAARIIDAATVPNRPSSAPANHIAQVFMSYYGGELRKIGVPVTAANLAHYRGGARARARGVERPPPARAVGHAAG
uniref:hypothetical protein n=1 Tax=Pseudomonas sp. TaxID=306 RepID=UPI002622FCB2